MLPLLLLLLLAYINPVRFMLKDIKISYCHGRCSPCGCLIDGRHLLLQQLPGDLGHQTSTVTTVVVSRACTAVLHAAQRTQRLQDNSHFQISATLTFAGAMPAMLQGAVMHMLVRVLSDNCVKTNCNLTALLRAESHLAQQTHGCVYQLAIQHMMLVWASKGTAEMATAGGCGGYGQISLQLCTNNLCQLLIACRVYTLCIQNLQQQHDHLRTSLDWLPPPQSSCWCQWSFHARLAVCRCCNGRHLC
jgi:hypothetical protein